MKQYFCRHTPLSGIEREMRLPGHIDLSAENNAGVCRLRYSPGDENCRRCQEERRLLCPSEAAELASGTLSYKEMVRRCVQNNAPTALWDRINRETERLPAVCWDRGHRKRLTRYLRRAGHPGGEGLAFATLATLYLLTATESLWQRTEVSLEKNTIALSSCYEREMDLQDTVLYRRARAIQRGRGSRWPDDLANEGLVEADTLRHIVNAALIERYGQHVLGAWKEEAEQ